MAPVEPEVHSKERLDDLLKDCSVSGPRDSNPFSVPKIQKVQPHLRKRTEFEKYYSPKLLSIGPIHHGDIDLKLGEHLKRRWAKAYFDEADAAEKLRQIIADNITELKKLYTEDAIEEYKDDQALIWILFVDGCSILHVMNKAGNSEIKAEDKNNAESWETKAAAALEIKIDQLDLLLQDMLLLENQLPYKLLVLLTGDDHRTEQSMLKLLRNHEMARGPITDNKMIPGPNTDSKNNDSHEIRIDGSPPAHLLDLLHKVLTWSSTPSRGPPTPSSCCQIPQTDDLHVQNPSQFGLLLRVVRYLKQAYQCLLRSQALIRNIQELKAAGIRLKRSRKASIEAVNFKSKRYRFWAPVDLELPEIIVDDFTAPTLMNLIAYEMCPDFHNNFDISSYVAFLDLLIDHENDVKELRSAGVLQNHLGNDEEVAKLFNAISTDLIANGSKYAHVRKQIKEHCNNKWNIYMAKLLSEHFSSPWTFIAFLTAVIITGLTVVQTWYTINPPK